MIAKRYSTYIRFLLPLTSSESEYLASRVDGTEVAKLYWHQLKGNRVKWVLKVLYNQMIWNVFVVTLTQKLHRTVTSLTCVNHKILHFSSFSHKIVYQDVGFILHHVQTDNAASYIHGFVAWVFCLSLKFKKEFNRANSHRETVKYLHVWESGWLRLDCSSLKTRVDHGTFLPYQNWKVDQFTNLSQGLEV